MNALDPERTPIECRHTELRNTGHESPLVRDADSKPPFSTTTASWPEASKHGWCYACLADFNGIGSSGRGVGRDNRARRKEDVASEVWS
jgi:hypothetical protein